jgi:biopolymer transport protein ExbD
MYNPIGSDNNLEFIEVYMEDPINLENYIITDNTNNDTLSTLKQTDSNYALIVEEGFDHSNINASVYNAGATIGNNLNNDGDSISLYNTEGYLIDFTSYDSTLANDNGKSLEKVDNNWQESEQEGGTPGLENGVVYETIINTTANNTNQTNINNTNNETNTNTTEDIEEPIEEPEQEDHDSGLKISIILDDELYSDVNYQNIFKIENLGHVSGTTDSINGSIYYNITQDSYFKENTFNIENLNAWKTSNTGNVKFPSPNTYLICGLILNSTSNDQFLDDNNICQEFEVKDASENICDLEISISTEKDIFNDGDKVKFYNNLNSEKYPYEITYWIEDMFEKQVKSEKITKNTNKKSWTIRSDLPAEAFIINAKVKALGCNDQNEENDETKKVIVVKNKREEESSITIDNIYLGTDEKAKFGEVVKVLTTIYKGNTSKYSIKFYIQNGKKRISETTTVHFHEKYNEHTMTIPIQLKTNCDLTYDDGVHELIIEGLDQRTQEKFKIEGSTGCNINGEEKQNKGKISYELIDFNNTIKVGKEFFPIIKITNNDSKKHNFSIWSYVYRGGKSYSGYKMENSKKFFINPGEEKKVILSNIITEAEQGIYKWKTQILKDNLKTPYELIEEIVIEEPPIKEKQEEQITIQEQIDETPTLLEVEISQDPLEIRKQGLETITGNVIYTSKSEKINSFTGYVLAGVFCLLCVALIFARMK